MNAEEGLSPDQALREVSRVDGRVRDSSRGPGWMFLIVGVATMVYWPVEFLTKGVGPAIAGVGWIILTIAACAYWFRLPVYEQRLMRINRQVSVVYVLACLVTFVVGAFVAPRHPTPVGWAVILVVLAVISGAIPLYGSWRLLLVRR
ncbi:hypothetical protein ACFHYQ_03355 [Sphaerimonospora cavernae]|uniref:Uncharacterized protein n=1 Tax=Sphaerimonospora cavernae TaxID=1740611 RepID=A0ABV6TYN4_9ACTN